MAERDVSLRDSAEARRVYEAEWSRNWRRKNPEAARAKSRAAYQRRKERLGAEALAAERRAAYVARRERVLEKKRVERLDPAVAEARRAAQRDWCARNPEKLARLRQAANLRRYGLTVESFDAMVATQGGLCACCGSELILGRSTHVDHDHETGVVRGVVCRHCNAAIGYVRDSSAVADAVATYLRKHGR